MENILELIRERRSVRSFDGGELSAAEKRALRDFASSVENPWGRYVEFRLLDKESDLLSSPVITGETAYLGAKTAKAPHAEEALGFSFEALMLYALSIRAFERAMDLESDELMPCVSPVGRPAAKMSLRETLMRRGAGPTSRLDFSALFFDGGFDRPLTEAAAGELLEPLKAVQRAPSAVNRQPWRVVRCGETLHFYLRHNRGYVTAVTGDLQKVDLGIALCHFALAAEAVGLRPRFSLADPGIEASPDCEYIVDVNDFYSKSRNTPFNGYAAKGRTMATFVDGVCIFSLLKESEPEDEESK